MLQLFSSTKTLFPPCGLPKTRQGYGFAAGRHSFDFAIAFPAESDCFETQKREFYSREALPSTLRVQTAELEIDVSYRLRAYVYRVGKFAPRDTVAERPIQFSFLKPPRLELGLVDEGLRSTSRLQGEDLGISTPAAGSQIPNELPGYTPTIFLEASVANLGELRPGDSLGLGLRLALPEGLISALGEITIYSLWIVLLSTTVVLVDGERRVSQTRLSLLSARPGVRFTPDQASRSNLRNWTVDNSSWEHCKIPQLAPSSKCCSFSHGHALQIRIGLRGGSCGRREKVE